MTKAELREFLDATEGGEEIFIESDGSLWEIQDFGFKDGKAIIYMGEEIIEE